MKHSLLFGQTLRLWCLSLVSVLLLESVPLPAQVLAQNSNRTVVKRQTDSYRLTDAIRMLKDRYGINILFEERSLRNLYVPGSAVLPQANVEASLTALLRPLGLNYRKVKSNYLILSSNADKKQQSSVDYSDVVPGENPAIISTTSPLTTSNQRSLSASDQSIPADVVVSGLVTDEKDEPLPGVSVVIKIPFPSEQCIGAAIGLHQRFS